MKTDSTTETVTPTPALTADDIDQIVDGLDNFCIGPVENDQLRAIWQPCIDKLKAHRSRLVAAPDLLDVVREFVELYDGLRAAIGPSMSELLARAEAAIAKATLVVLAVLLLATSVQAQDGTAWRLCQNDWRRVWYPADQMPSEPRNATPDMHCSWVPYESLEALKTVPLPVEVRLRRSRRIAKVLRLSALAAVAGDLGTTAAVLQHGGRETNPILQPPGTIVKAAAIDIGTLVGVAALEASHPRIAKLLYVGVIATRGFATIHNAREIR